MPLLPLVALIHIVGVPIHPWDIRRLRNNEELHHPRPQMAQRQTPSQVHDLSSTVGVY